MNHPLASVRITDFDPSVTDGLALMWRESFEFGVGVTDPHPIDEQAAYFRSEVVPQNRVRMAWSQGELVAFMASTPRVHHAAAPQGRAHRARHWYAVAPFGAGRVVGYLWLYTFKRNEHACRFYEHHGFKVASRGFEPTWQLEDVKYIWAKEQGAA